MPCEGEDELLLTLAFACACVHLCRCACVLDGRDVPSKEERIEAALERNVQRMASGHWSVSPTSSFQ